jgi:PhzF family phenazine biosynthesis protein
MSQKIYQIDAFAETLFSGNPAAVCPLENWLDADIMQKIAAENNLAETAFTVPVENGFEIRWFTPEVEVDLCGHATLASAYTLMNFEGFSGEKINSFLETAER